MQRMLGALRQADSAAWAPGTADQAPALAGQAREAAGPAPIPAARAAPLAPAAGLADLGRLVAGTAGAGVRVEVTRTGPAGAVPAGVDLSAFRIVHAHLVALVCCPCAAVPGGCLRR
jgi:hypothetical protein